MATTGPRRTTEVPQNEETTAFRRGYGHATTKVQTEFECVKILYTNARSLLSKIDELSILAIDNSPDVIIITETWCNNTISNAMLNINGYSIEPNLRIDRTDTANGIGGGIIVYCKTGLTIKPSSVNDFIQYCRFEIVDKSNKNNLEITVIYRSPN